MSNNGLITKIWGPPSWKFLHSVTFGYPENPDDNHKKNYKRYFELVGDILPCGACRESYKRFINEGHTQLTDDVMKNRETFTRWFYNVHQRVNKKLEIDYGTKYEHVVARYENYRAKDRSNKNQCGGHRRVYRLTK